MDCLYSALYKQILFLSGGAASEAIDIGLASSFTQPVYTGSVTSIPTSPYKRTRKRRFSNGKEDLVHGLLPEEIDDDFLVLRNIKPRLDSEPGLVVLPPIRTLLVDDAHQDNITTLPPPSLRLHHHQNCEGLLQNTENNNKENAVSYGVTLPPISSKIQDSRTVFFSGQEKTKTSITHPPAATHFLP